MNTNMNHSQSEVPVTTKRSSAIFIAVCALVAGIVFGILLATPEPGTIRLGPCQTEDSTNCYWDAAQHGNGQGVPFLSVDGETYYPALDGGFQLPTK